MVTKILVPIVVLLQYMTKESLTELILIAGTVQMQWFPRLCGGHAHLTSHVAGIDTRFFAREGKWDAQTMHWL